MGMRMLFNEQTVDAWIGAIGSFAGTLVAGLLTVFIYKHQVKLSRKKEAENEFETFMKFGEKYQLLLSPIMKNLDLMKKHLDEGNIENFKNLVDTNVDMFEEMKKLNASELSYTAESKFMALNHYLEFILFQTALYKKSGSEIQISNFSDNLKQLKEVEKEMNDYRKSLKKRAS
ncbi:hypothetical protein ELQ35_22145 [Peribacillus cavernae]|uniref:Uncharacterized protein n=1 Tax=Peribacillus cavernae TaxID=1674310 RepID=A0A433H7C0_9BACI|nr:hypothetical protein [Peribacillus cavernae]MDQ0220145.1 soluble cytochrome b562 [Peribacillus cavernae]RUQ24202.1 hypothetical protein ELQ35_22145 [Peribacillus cavernae]